MIDYKKYIGRMVFWRGKLCKLVNWEPLLCCHCDATILLDRGELAVSSFEVRLPDGARLPDRMVIGREAEQETIRYLKSIRKGLVGEIKNGPRWEGCEHGKAILGRAIDGALRSLKDV